jgi:ABC-type uncharacterized transport system permease subunit
MAALVVAIATVKFHTEHMVSGLAVNILALGLTSFMLRAMVGGGQAPVEAGQLAQRLGQVSHDLPTTCLRNLPQFPGMANSYLRNVPASEPAMDVNHTMILVHARATRAADDGGHRMRRREAEDMWWAGHD